MRRNAANRVGKTSQRIRDEMLEPIRNDEPDESRYGNAPAEDAEIKGR